MRKDFVEDTKENKKTYYMTFGYAWGKACEILDNGGDPRKTEIPKVADEGYEVLTGNKN